ncbi:DUF3558 domain-containing protein [Streptomyces sp. NPDC051567]|uniref:DUF3558 domain-containing protein n=1 Tax=Streptomyces sp. NPDC051567 TaxID=3365660 RepID=UPI00379184FF
MQRKAVRRVLPGIAVLTALVAGAAGLTGCSGGSGGGGTTDAKAGSSAAPPAPPGKYRSLPSACKATEGKRLRAMLPAADTLTEGQVEQLYEGTPDVSYDGDRRVGCRWSAQTPEETRLLSVGFERVISYDRATTSDDEKAQEVYTRRLTDARLPAPATTATQPTPTSSSPAPPVGAPATTPAQPSAGTAPPSSPAPGATPVPGTGPTTGASNSAAPGPAPELGSRVLEGLGSEAFLDDKLSAAGASAAQARTVRIVFRTSNVIVTVEYAVQPALPGAVPPSTETQDRARQLAQALAERLSD